MELREIDASTEDTFMRCLHDEMPADPRVMAMRREWRALYQPKGHRARVLIDDADRVVGLTNYIPIEHSPYEGAGLMAILCMWIHGYDHLVGNQQSKGHGRFMLECIEEDARRSGCQGMAAWGKDYKAWNPVSFYEHMGYRRADQSGLDVLVWKPFTSDASPPAFLEPKAVLATSAGMSDQVTVTSFRNGWCGGGCQQCVMVRDAIAELPESNDRVVLSEIYAHEKSDLRERGESLDAVYIDGEPFRPDGPPASQAEFQQAVLDRWRAKRAD